MSSRIINYSYTSNIGKLRKRNQDNFYCATEYMNYENNGTQGVIEGKISKLSKKPSLFAIFDGMGGEEFGEMAAYIASKEMAEYEFGEDTEEDFALFCKSANAKICEYIDKFGLNSMGTTAAILGFLKNEMCLCNVGDSKIFKFSDEELKQISVDHVAPAPFGKKPPLLQNLGIPEDEFIIEPYITRNKVCAGDKYLICSDGLTDMVSLEDITEILKEENEKEAVTKLLDTALENGGRDNVTIVLISVKKKKFLKFFG